MNFKIYKLKDLVENFSVRARDYGGSDGLEFLGVSNDDGIVKSKSAAEHKGEEYKIIEKGCFAYNPYRINIGSIAYHNEDVKGLISPAYVVFKTKPSSIKDNLLFKFLKSSEGLRQIKFHGRGTVRQALRFEDLCKIEILLPSYEDQEKLIFNLEKTEIESKRISDEFAYQIDLIKQLRQAFLREAMQGNLVNSTSTSQTGHQLLAKIKAEKIQLQADKKIKKEKELPTIVADEIPFEIPEHWVWCRLGEILKEIKYGTSESCDFDSTKNSAVLRIPNVSNGEINIEDLKYANLSAKEKQDLSLEENDILIVRSNGSRELVGKTVLVKKEFIGFCYAGYLIRLRYNSKLINSNYLSLVSKSPFFRKMIETPLRTTVGINNINAVEISLLKIPLPPIDEQELIVIKLNELMTFCDCLEKSIKESQDYNDILLQQVLREALQPQENVKTISIESRKIENPLKTILAGHIINLNNTTDFGRVKFQKLLFLTEYICKIDFDSNYIKKVAGPYDDVLIKNIEADFNRMRFFNVVQDNTDNKRVRYHALAGATELESLFQENFTDELIKINNTLLKFRPLSWGECELIATLYAVWNNRIIKNELITDELLYSDFMAWDAQKKKYHSVFHKWLFWMKDEKIIPDGWGKYIDKPN
jgi:type I restriction enzyme S subunit